MSLDSVLDTFRGFQDRVSRARLARASSDPQVCPVFERTQPRTVDVSSIPLVNPGPSADVSVASRMGLPNPADVVVMMLFIGTCASACESVLNMMKTWFNRANVARASHGNRNQLEVILVSAHKHIDDFISIVQDVTNPFFSVPFGSETHRKLLADFDVTDDAAEFVPRLAVLEWLGARTFDRFPVARECRTIRNPLGFVEDLHLHPLVGPIDTSPDVVESRPLVQAVGPSDLPPAEYPITDYYWGDHTYPAISRVQSVREHCSYFYEEVRDNLYELRTDRQSQAQYLSSLWQLGEKVCAKPPNIPRAFDPAVEYIVRQTGSDWILMLIGAAGRRQSSGRPKFAINCAYFRHFVVRWVKRFQQFQETPGLQKVYFPPVKVSAKPGTHMYLIRIYYRSHEWSAIRDVFPSNIGELRALVESKVMYVNMGAAKLFSEQLNPRLADPSELVAEGLTARFGSLQYNSLEEISEYLEAAPIFNGMRKIRIIVMGPRSSSESLRFSKPATNKNAVLERVHEMLGQISKIDLTSIWLKDAIKAASVVTKLAEVDEYQEEILRRIPVQDLHLRAAQSINQIRSGQIGGVLEPNIIGTSPDPDLSLIGGVSPTEALSIKRLDPSMSRPNPLRGSWEKQRSRSGSQIEPTYDEELLKQLIKWFSDSFFNWLPGVIDCAATEGCGGDMVHWRTDPTCSQELDVFDLPIEHALLKHYLVEHFRCKKCLKYFDILRPVHDVQRLCEFPQGRCGEFAKVFTVAARALGFETRMVVGKLRYPESPGAPRHKRGDTDHFWNEVNLGDSRQWIQVDVSPSLKANAMEECGTVVRDVSLKFDHKDAFKRSGMHLLAAVQVSKSDCYVVTNNYLSTPDEVSYATLRFDMSTEVDEIETVSRIIQETDVNEHDHADVPQNLRELRELHRRRLDNARMKAKFPEDLAPSVGKGYVAAEDPRPMVFGPGGSRLIMTEGEIPNHITRPLPSLFHTYNRIMRFDGIENWYVCVCEVTKVGRLVAKIRFGYCDGPDPRETVRIMPAPYTWGSTFMHEFEGAYPKLVDTEVVATEIAYNDWIADVIRELDPETGLLSRFEPVLGRSLGLTDPTDTQLPVVGFYGSMRSHSAVGIDFIGLYRHLKQKQIDKDTRI